MKRVLVLDKDKFQDALRVAMKESSDKFELRDRFMRILYDFRLPGNLLALFEGRVEKPEQGRALYQITLPPPAVTALYATKPKWDGFGSTEKKFHVLILHVPTCPDERGTKEGEEK